MLVFYYSLSFIFIWMNLFYLSNISKIDVRFYNQDFKQVSKVFLVYYFTRISYWIWLFIGIFLPISNFILIIFVINILRFIIYFVNKNIFKYYNVLVPFFTIIIIISMIMSLLF
jgi:hypothetical protein